MTDYSTPPSIPVQDGMTAARAAGYPWSDITETVAAPQQAAIQAGYSSTQIDRHLGYPDPTPTNDKLDAHIVRASAEPAGEPKLVVPDDTVPGVSAAPAARPVDLPANMRQIYADGIVNGEEKGPSDFADKYAAAHARAGAAAPLSADELKPTLPSIAEFTDYSIQLLHDNDIPPTPASVNTVKENLADAWAQTGMSPSDIYARSMSNQSVSDSLTRPQPVPEPIISTRALPLGVTTPDSLLDHIAKGESGGNYTALYGGGSTKGLPVDDTGFPQWAGKDNSHAAGKYQFEPATWHAEYSKLGLQGGMTPENQDKAAWDLAQTDYNRRTGNDLGADLATGTKGQEIADALHSTWTSLGHESSGGIMGTVASMLSSARSYVASEWNQISQDVAGLTRTDLQQAPAALGELATETGHAVERVLLPSWLQPEAAQNDSIEALGGLMDFATGGLLNPLAPEATAAAEGARAVREGALAKPALETNELGEVMTKRPGEAGAIGNITVTPPKVPGEAPLQADVAQVATRVNNVSNGIAGVLNPAKNFVTSPTSQEYRASKAAQKTDLIRMQGITRQAEQQTAVILNKASRTIQKYQPEYDKWIDSGTAQTDARTARDNHFDLQDHLANGGTPDTFTPKNPQPTMPAIQQLYDHMQGVPGTKLPVGSDLYPVADGLRKVFDSARDALDASGHDVSGWTKDYFTQLWKDPNQAERIVGAGGRTGTNRFLKQRSIPTINDGIAAGLKPAMGPLETVAKYSSGIHAWINYKDMMARSEQAGRIVWDTHAPDGLMPLKGASSTRALGPGLTERAYAQPGAAAVYNAWSGQGYLDWMSPKNADILGRIANISNGMTALNLAVPGFHVYAETVEGLAGQVGLGIRQFSRGQVLGGLKSLGLATSVVGPVIRNMYRGNQLIRQGLRIQEEPIRQGLRIPDYGKQAIADLYMRTGGSMIGRGQEFGGQSANLFQKIQRGIYLSSLQEDLKSVLGRIDESLGGRLLKAPFRGVSAVMAQIGDAMRTITAPVFDWAIPRVKFSQWADDMQSWIKAHPQATQEDIEAYGQRVNKTIDNRFGELVQDNLFINRTIKQVLNTGVVSLGWELGSSRGFMEAGKELATGRVFGPNATWVIGFLAAVGYTNSVRQYLNTGTSPLSSPTPFLDMLLPRNGGINPDNSPSRDITPSPVKDLIQGYKALTAGTPPEVIQALKDVVVNKFNPFVRTVNGIATGLTWMNTPIAQSYRGAGGHSVGTGILPNPNYSANTPLAAPPWWTSYLDWFLQNTLPLTVQMGEQKSAGWWDTVAGVRHAPPVLGDTEAYAGSLAARDKRAAAEGLGYARYENKQLANPDTTIPMARERRPFAAPRAGRRFNDRGL